MKAGAKQRANETIRLLHCRSIDIILIRGQMKSVVSCNELVRAKSGLKRENKNVLKMEGEQKNERVYVKVIFTGKVAEVLRRQIKTSKRSSACDLERRKKKGVTFNEFELL